MGINALPVILAWTSVLLLELLFAWQGMIRPSASQLLLEVMAIAVVAVGQVRLARNEWQRSAWWPGVLSLWITAVAVGPSDHVDRLFFTIGTGVIAWFFVRMASRRLELLPLTLFAAVLGGVGARWLVLDRAAQSDLDQFGDVIAVADATGRLSHELQGIARGGGTAGDGPPLVLITVDTLRADHAIQMESWRRLLGQGHGWQRGVSTSSWTLPAVTSMHTGAPSELHGAGVRPGGGYQLGDPALPMVAERLDDAGYLTAAFVTNSWLETSMGFGRGFDVFLHSNEAFPHRLLVAGLPRGLLPVDGKAIVDRALGWLDDAPEQGWFLWVHLVDPHMPYFNATEPLCANLRDGNLRDGQLTTEAQRQQLRDCYADEVAYTDQQLMRLLDGLEAKGVLEDGLVLFAADHGEEFWDHGGIEHGHSHHTEVVEVALAVAGAGVSPEGTGPASVMDVAPTLLAAAGLDTKGIDLRSGVPDDRVATAWGNNYYREDRSVRSATHTVILRGDPRGPEQTELLAFERTADPNETRALDDPPAALVEQVRAITPPEAREEADINTEALRALGYID